MAFLQASQTEVKAEAKRAAELATEREANRQRELENQRQLATEQSRRARILRNAALVAGLLFILATFTAGVSFYLNRQLQQKISETRRLANLAFSRQLAAQSIVERNQENLELAWLLGAEAVIRQEPSEPFENLLTILASEPSFSGIALQPNDHRLPNYEASSGVVIMPLSADDFITYACQRTARNFSQTEWAFYFGGETYRKTCAKLP